MVTEAVITRASTMTGGCEYFSGRGKEEFVKVSYEEAFISNPARTPSG